MTWELNDEEPEQGPSKPKEEQVQELCDGKAHGVSEEKEENRVSWITGQHDRAL